MTSPLVKHFLNNMCGGEHVTYLEIGSWQGATITAASCNNPGRFLAIENFSESGGRDEFRRYREITAQWCHFTFLERDCWTVRPEEIANPGSVDVYFYDGAHDFESQVKAFVHFQPLFASEFVAVIDDWNHPPVRKGTRVALDQLNMEIVKEWELPARFNGDVEAWWNGLFVAVVRTSAPGSSVRSTQGTRLLPVSDRSASQAELAPTALPVRHIPESARLVTAPVPGASRSLAIPPPTLPRVPTVAIVVACHNYGHWLSEAVESALGQTHPASEILIVDDSSTDQTPQVAAKFAAQGVRYLRINAHSVWTARKTGFLATKADVLCFLDADDRLNGDYLEKGLPLFDAGRVAIVYSDVEQFGQTRGRIQHPPFDRSRLETENFLHTGSLVRRRALEVSKAFDAPEPHSSHADWYLWRRVCEAGFIGVKQSSLYYYRRHQNSMIMEAAKRRTSHFEFGDLALQPLTIVCPLSGRTWAWGRYRDWLERQRWPRTVCSLLIIDSGTTPGVREWLANSGYSDTRYLEIETGPRGLADLPRMANAGAVRLAVSRVYNRMARVLETPFAFIVEDDVIPPLDVIERLMRSMDKHTAAVTAAYPSRFVSGFVAWRKPGDHLPESQGVEEVNGCGFGSLLIRRAVIQDETFTSLPGESPDFDIAYFLRLRSAGWKIKVDWNARAEHMSPPQLPGRIDAIGGKESVSVIITARNNGSFLRDAIQSTLNQSIRPLEILYSDDGSTDGSVEIASEFPQVRVLAAPHRGVCEARNRACREARGEYLLHLDGDDIFPHRFIQQRLDVARKNPHAAFVYGPAQAFGGEWNYYWDAPEWNLERLWNGNYVNTSTLFRRDAFEKVGMWRETFGTAWDWDLALRLGKAGFRGIRDASAFLLYRHHANSTSRLANIKDLKSDVEEGRMKFLVRVHGCRSAILSIVSGRVIELFDAWLDALRRNIRYHADKIRGQALYAPGVTLEAPLPALKLLYTGPKEGLGRIERALRDDGDFNGVSIVHEPWTSVHRTEEQRRDNVAHFLAQAYNRLLGEEELTWLIEDDVVPPDEAYHEMVKSTLSAPRPLYAVSASYRNRHDTNHFLAYKWDGKDAATIQTLNVLPDRPSFVDMCGTGCLLIFRPFARHMFYSHINGIPAHDWRWCLDLKVYSEEFHPESKKVLLLPHIVCRHYQDVGNFV